MYKHIHIVFLSIAGKNSKVIDLILQIQTQASLSSLQHSFIFFIEVIT